MPGRAPSFWNDSQLKKALTAFDYIPPTNQACGTVLGLPGPLPHRRCIDETSVRPRGGDLIGISPAAKGAIKTMSSEQADDLARTKAEFNKFAAGYDHADFLVKARARTRQVFADQKKASRYIFDRALQSLASRDALSMIRLGDGEGNLLRFAERMEPFECKWAGAILQMMDGQAFDFDEIRLIAGFLTEAVDEADIIGLRPLSPMAVELQIRAIANAIGTGDIRAATGMMTCFQHAAHAIDEGLFLDKVLTGAWVHLGLLDHLDDLLDSAHRTIVITGRGDLQELFSTKLGHRLVEFLLIPLQASEWEGTARPSHYPARFYEVASKLDRDLGGTLVLVGAGPWGKRYCSIAKQRGGVALDLGSAFDVLAGRRTRPVHSMEEFIDVNRTIWLR